MHILVTGGAGYIGSHTVLSLLESGYSVHIADNFVNSKPAILERLKRLSGRSFGFTECDLTDPCATEKLFSENNFDAVIHFAGLKAVGESVEKPLAYYHNNLISTIQILEAMKRHGVLRFVFSSSATVYGDPASVPISEDFPLSATNPYGQTKLMIETMLRDIAHAAPDMRICLLRYFNPVGAHPSGIIGEDPAGIPNNLMPYIAQVAIGKRAYLNVFGNDYHTPDGTGIRDYIHVCDLAEGHVAALKRLEESTGVCIYNLGTGTGYSVLDVLHAFERTSSKPIPYEITGRRAGDIAACWANPARAEKELHWRAARNLDDMCRDSWNWQRNNPSGYDE